MTHSSNKDWANLFRLSFNQTDPHKLDSFGDWRARKFPVYSTSPLHTLQGSTKCLIYPSFDNRRWLGLSRWMRITRTGDSWVWDVCAIFYLSASMHLSIYLAASLHLQPATWASRATTRNTGVVKTNDVRQRSSHNDSISLPLRSKWRNTNVVLQNHSKSDISPSAGCSFHPWDISHSRTHPVIKLNTWPHLVEYLGFIFIFDARQIGLFATQATPKTN